MQLSFVLQISPSLSNHHSVILPCLLLLSLRSVICKILASDTLSLTMKNGAQDYIPIAFCSPCTPCRSPNELSALGRLFSLQMTVYRRSPFVWPTTADVTSALARYTLTGSSLCITPYRPHYDAGISCFVQLLLDKGQSIRCSFCCKCLAASGAWGVDARYWCNPGLKLECYVPREAGLGLRPRRLFLSSLPHVKR